MERSVETTWQPSRRLSRGGAAEQILEDLRSRILSGQLARGARLPTEKQLAEGYGVSGPTVREAIRGLTTANLVEVRHGSGAYVTAEPDQLISAALLSMMQLERVGIAEVLGVLGVLNAYAAELAAAKASEADIEALKDALQQIDKGPDAAAIADGLRRLADALAKASGNVLLGVLCRFLAGVQVALGRQLTGDVFEAWRKTTRALAKDRQRVVDAIAAHDTDAARDAARKHVAHSAKVIASLPHAHDTVLSDPAMTELLTSMLQQR